MLYTKEWVEQKYTEFNAKFFNNQLPPFSNVQFTITNDKKTFGRGGSNYTYNRQTNTYTPTTAILKLSNYYDNTEKWKAEVLIHEMVHIYEYTVEPKYIIETLRTGRRNSYFPSHGHGVIFYREAKRLNQLGFNIERFVSKDEINDAVLSPDNVEKIKRNQKNGLKILFLKYRNPYQYNASKIYNYGYVKIMTNDALLKWKKLFDEDAYMANKFTEIDLYECENIDAWGKLNRTNLGKWFLTNDKDGMIERLSATKIGSLKEGSVDIMSKNDDTNKFDSLKESIANSYNDIAKEIANHLFINWVNDEDDETDYDRCFIGKVKNTMTLSDGTKLKWAFNADKYKFGIINGTLYLYDWESVHPWHYSLASEVDYMEVDESDKYHYNNVIEDLEDLILKAIGTNKREVQQNNAPQQDPNFVKHFRMQTTSGKIIDLVNTTKDEIRAKIKETFPNWSETAIENNVNNPKFYMETLNENKLKEIVAEVFQEELAKRMNNGQESQSNYDLIPPCV